MSVLLGRSHIISLEFQLPISEDTCGARRMGLWGKISQFMRPLPLMLARWTNVGGPISIAGRLIHSSSEVSISRINTEVVVKRIRQISNSPTNPNAEGSDELGGEEVDVVCNSAGHQSSTSPSQPSAIIFQCQVIPSTPKDFQQFLSIIHPDSPSTSTAGPALVSTVRPSPIPQPRNSLMVTTQQLQPVASSSRIREDQSPLPFPATKVLQKREHWPIWVTREDPNMAN
ncbi:hypothetical protein O181_016721 [Austropuccinia psidii MF-1]|uniref:Uncharacterized protein n=1 Tax=Austropuccinia psidii MF-1 TaxID=1389203 RepID=A0A9Q3C694_9BASI|nr:hypothetical protein [Austropuccinia psidii MF-1]